MFASKTEIVLYSVLAVGIFVGLHFDVSVWLLIGFATLIGVVDSSLGRRRKGEQRKGTRALGPNVQDWALLGTSLAFCAVALLLVTHDWRAAVVTITFFGSCALVFWTNILRKRREKQWQGATVKVAGRVNIYAKGAHMPAIAFGCMFVGSVCCFIGIDYPLLFRLLGAFIALVGVGVAIALALGFYRRQYLRFDPDAITFGERTYRYQVGWDNIADVDSIEYADNPFVGIRLCNAEIVTIDPVQETEAFRKHVASNRALMNVDIFIAPRNFGIDGTVLAAALARYATNPSAREELQHRSIAAISSRTD